MNVRVSYVCVALLTLIMPAKGVAQKVKVGYDKSADFGQYKTYTWGEPDLPPSRPGLYAVVVGSVDHQLKTKGLTSTQTDPDLIVAPCGGIEFGFSAAAGTPVLPSFSGVPPTIDATMWTGAGGSSAYMNTAISAGNLTLAVIDRKLNRVIWTGTVSVNLDMEHKSKSIELVDKSITKLLKDFPPKKR